MITFQKFTYQKAAFNIFLKFSQTKLLKKLWFQTNLYATQNDVNTTFKFNVAMSGIKKFIGIIIYMGIVILPAINDYQKTDTSIPQIANVMSRDSIKTIRSTLHFDNN